MSNIYRILVTGPRTWDDQYAVDYHLNLQAVAAKVAGYDEVVLVDGMADGADWLCFKWAKRHGIRVEEHPADWKKDGRVAGLLRNNRMVELGAEVCIAFLSLCRQQRCVNTRPHWTHGTDHCRTAAKRAGIQVVEVIE